MAKLGPVEWLLSAAGLSLLVAAVKNESPMGVVREAFTGAGRAPITTARVAVGSYPLDSSGNPNLDDPGAVGPYLPGTRPESGGGLSVAPMSGRDPADLVTVPGHPSDRLRAPASAAFVQWERLFGRTLPLTPQTYRTFASQAALYARDSSRYGRPESSAHVRGEGVDINLAAAGITNPTKGDPTYDRLVSTGKSAGWCNAPSVYAKGEPWHFSWGGCR